MGEEIANAGIEESAFRIGGQQLLVDGDRDVTVAINLAGAELDPELSLSIGNRGQDRGLHRNPIHGWKLYYR
jgi:hypothetical protein